MTYSIRFTVDAATKLEAIDKAVAKLRSSLKLVAVLDASPAGAPWWVVRLQVAEDA